MLHVYIHISNMPFSIGQSRLQKPAFGPQTQSRQTNTTKKQYKCHLFWQNISKYICLRNNSYWEKNDVTYPLVN